MRSLVNLTLVLTCLAYNAEALAQINVILDPQSPIAAGYVSTAINDFNNGCSTRAGKPGFPSITTGGSGTPVYAYADKSSVPSMFDPELIPDNACGATPANNAYVLVFAQAVANGNTFACPGGDTTLHEIMAHVMELGHTGGGIAAPGQLNNGVVVDRDVTEDNCRDADLEHGGADYDENGDFIGVDTQGNSPIILDTGGRGGIWTTGARNPVLFDIDSEGEPKFITWSAAGRGQAFLVVDLSGNGLIDDGGELFGTGTYLHRDGRLATHGFDAMAQYDEPALGGNADGVLDSRDAIWRRLRLWSDVNHDAVSAPHEIHELHEYGVVALELGFVETAEFDRHGNWHRYRGFFQRKAKIRGRWMITRELMEDVFFQSIE